MSLINDALKRATQAQAIPPAQKSDPGAPMLPAESHKSVGVPSYFVPVLLSIFCGAFWFLVQGWEARRQSGFYPEPLPIAARELAPTTEVTSAPASPYADLESTAEPDPATATPVGRQFGLDHALTPQTSASPATPADGAYRLQGIFYRPSDPSAVVNTKTVYVGDLISGGRVKAIDREKVVIERDGATTVLTLQ